MNRSSQVTSPTNESQRLASIDILRGLAIIGMFLVTKKTPALQLRHVEWFGCHIADLVYPLFLFLSGVSSSLSLRKYLATGEKQKPPSPKKAYLRLVKLFLVGLALSSISAGRLKLEPGTLQCIALASALALPLRLTSTRLQIICGAFTALAFGLLSAVNVAAMGDIPTALSSWTLLTWSSGNTLAEWVDTAAFGSHRGPEGILATFAYSAFVVFGMAAGQILGHGAQTQKEDLKSISLSGLAIGLAATFLALFLAGSWEILSPLIAIPLTPQLPSPTFILGATGACLVLLSATSAAATYPTPLSWSKPLQVYGLNPLAAYAFVKLIQALFFDLVTITTGGLTVTVKQWLLTTTAPHISPWIDPAWSFPILKVLLGWVFCWILWQRKIVVKL